MIFSYNWLKEFVELPDDPSELARVMTFGGIEVEDYHARAANLQDIIIVKIIKVEKHPDADKLHVCLIDTGSGTKQVVCGAPNCQQGMLAAYAPVGLKLGNLIITQVNIRGVESEGMLCSEKELEISDDHSGIISLPEDAPIGMNLRRYFQISDTIFDVEITPNRPDLLGLLGLARDVAALRGKALQLPDSFPSDGYLYPQGTISKISSEALLFNLTNEAPDLCPRYLARVILGVKIKESPSWLKDKLLAVDIKPINNLVDITNYVMLEFGHPLHAFDYDLLDGKEIRVRRARKGEVISALDHKDYSLLETDLVIADGSNPVAIAGIIGGANSAITTDTKKVVLEAANFYHLSIRKTAARFKINTDSAYRFERNLSNETVALISQRATDLICELCGGEVIHLIDSYPSPISQVTVDLRTKRANDLLTTNLTNLQICDYLRPLGLIVEDIVDHQELERIPINKPIRYSVPPYRKDLNREIDLIEEVIRLHGYNNISEKPKREVLTNLGWFYQKRAIADYLVYNGFYEAINSSFMEPTILSSLKLSEDDFRASIFELINPLGVSFSMMRTTLLPGLLKNVQFNIANGQSDIKLFELGKVYLKKEQEPAEHYFLTGILYGNISSQHWKYKTEKTSIFTVKGYVEGLLNKLTDLPAQYRDFDVSYYQQGSGIEISINDEVIGNLGKIDPLLVKSLDIEQALFVFDLDISRLLRIGGKKTTSFQEINKYPPVSRDISFIAHNRYRHQEIEQLIKTTNPEMIRNIKLIDEFRGKNIPSDHRSLTYSIVISSREGTLTDETVNNLLEAILKKLELNFKIEMR